MNVYKLVPVQIEIDDITTLSGEEYKAAKNNIPSIDDYWRLRSPGIGSALIVPGGFLAHGPGVFVDFVCVRPALRVNPKSMNLQIGDKVQFEGCIWTYIAEGILLCDTMVGKMLFRNSWRDENVPVFDESDVTKYPKELYKTWKEKEK